MATKRIKKSIDEDELGRAAGRGTTRQKSPLGTRLAPRPSHEHLDSEKSELAVAGFVRLPDEGLPDSFWGMPAPHVSFMEAVSAITSERGED
jgi:hypothetical protein